MVVSLKGKCLKNSTTFPRSPKELARKVSWKPREKADGWTNTKFVIILRKQEG